MSLAIVSNVVMPANLQIFGVNRLQRRKPRPEFMGRQSIEESENVRSSQTNVTHPNQGRQPCGTRQVVAFA